MHATMPVRGDQRGDRHRRRGTGGNGRDPDRERARHDRRVVGTHDGEYSTRRCRYHPVANTVIHGDRGPLTQRQRLVGRIGGIDGEAVGRGVEPNAGRQRRRHIDHVQHRSMIDVGRAGQAIQGHRRAVLGRSAQHRPGHHRRVVGADNCEHRGGRRRRDAIADAIVYRDGLDFAFRQARE